MVSHDKFEFIDFDECYESLEDDTVTHPREKLENLRQDIGSLLTSELDYLYKFYEETYSRFKKHRRFINRNVVSINREIKATEKPCLILDQYGRPFRK